MKKGIHGFGDASCVGSGKTLTALAISARLIEMKDKIYSGILILLPCNQLISTWKEEINKHTEGFDLIIQDNSTFFDKIKRNTIVVTTVARIRDHPIFHTWQLVVIDECLSVQNKSSLQAESAWKQSLMSKHLLMMSATFFRARFDKLYYMLKMLQTGLPENKDYLNTILLESIVSQISHVNRKWISEFHYFELDDETRKEYQKINNMEVSTEIKFGKLYSLLVSSSKTNKYLVKQLKKLLKKREKKGNRCLLYARAMEEAELWSNKLKIPIYPKKGNHCIITYHDGTYGLNDLVDYDTIIMRPPSPDILPQIKGRLDRPGQKKNELKIDYFVLKDTIEMGLIIRLDIASQFVENYIMPLSNFYDISINHSKYSFPDIDSR
jgi:superfamily II DNA or RNA helicase